MRLATVAVVLGCLAVRCAVAADATERLIALSCQFDSPKIEQVDGKSRVTVPGCQTQNRAGEPCLPFRTVRVLLPPGCIVEKIRGRMLSAQVAVALPGSIERGRDPLPSGRMWTSADSDGAQVQPNTVIISPARRAELVSVQRLDGHAIAIVRLFPAQYVEAERRLEFCSRWTVELSLTSENPEATVFAPNMRGAARVRAFVDNPRTLPGTVGADAEQFQPAGEPPGPPQFDYLLVTKSFLLPSFQPLVELKIADGLAVKTETMENILASQPGRDSPEKLRNYIRFAYTNWGVRYVLLGGDIETVPCRYAYVYANQPEFDSHIPCDLYYSCLDGSWNSDNDSRWGEPTDGDDGGDVDLLGEVYVGRAPVDTVQEAVTWVAKTVRYELDGNPNAGNARFLATYLGFYAPGVHAQGGDMLDPLLPSFSRFTVEWLDDRPFTTAQWGAASALTALNRSPHVAIYNGHGDIDSLMQLGLGDLDALTNQHLFLAYSVGCNAGEFDNDQFSPDCIGEQLLTRHGRGAFAAILNSRLGWFNSQNEEQFSGEFQTRFFAELLARGHPQLGVAHLLSKHDMIGHVETSGLMTYRWCYYEINLLGDPHVAIKPPFSGVTPQGTPHWWLASHGWTNNYEAAALADTDTDGAPAWEEFVAGTSPVEALSTLRVTCTYDSGGCVLQWPGAIGRRYSVHGSTNPAVGSFVELTNNLPATPPVNGFAATAAGAGRTFYRIGVQRGP